MLTAAVRTRYGSRLKLTCGATAVPLAGVCALILFAAPTAFAGSAAVCDQYPDLPQCETGGGSGDGDPGTDEGAVDPAAGGGEAGQIPGGAGESATGGATKAGALPFTGYPLTPLVLFFVVLIAGGLLIRAYLALRDRLGVRTPGAG